MKLACGDHTFPLLELPAVLDLISAMGFDGFDLALMGNRSHIRPEEVRHDVRSSAVATGTEIRRRGLEISDVFLIPWTDFERYAPNHPDAEVRAESRALFVDMAEYAEIIGAPGITTLPGIDFPEVSHDASLARAAEELQWRGEHLAQRGMAFSVECHIGSVAASPRDARLLLDGAPALRLTLDYSHFISAGFAQAEVDELIPFARHLQIRGAAPNRPQCGLRDNTIDHRSVVEQLGRVGYHGYLAIEYVWDEWQRMNECDNVSETILMRDLLTSFAN